MAGMTGWLLKSRKTHAGMTTHWQLRAFKNAQKQRYQGVVTVTHRKRIAVLVKSMCFIDNIGQKNVSFLTLV